MRSQRLKVYINYIKKHHIVKWSDLFSLVDSSESTVRRDIEQLQTQGIVKIVNGGVESIEEQEERFMEDRYKLNIKQKNAIAAHASSLINDNDFIFIDAGSTTQRMIHYIKAKNISVVTNGINVAHALVKKKIKVYFLGGQVRLKSFAAVGEQGQILLQKMAFSKSFLGTNGISHENGFSTPHIEEAKIKQLVIEKSTNAYVVADETKFDVKNLFKFADLDSAIILTNKKQASYKKNIIVV